jgi:hypothetical protein
LSGAETDWPADSGSQLRDFTAAVFPVNEEGDVPCPGVILNYAVFAAKRAAHSPFNDPVTATDTALLTRTRLDKLTTIAGKQQTLTRMALAIDHLQRPIVDFSFNLIDQLVFSDGPIDVKIFEMKHL